MELIFLGVCFIYWVTPDFHKSNWTDQEIDFAYGRGVPIISIKLGQDPSGFIEKFQALSCKLKDVPLEICKILIKTPKMVDAFVTTINECASYDEANCIYKLLSEIQILNENQILQLISAFENNDQISDSYAFKRSSRVKGLV